MILFGHLGATEISSEHNTDISSGSKLSWRLFGVILNYAENTVVFLTSCVVKNKVISVSDPTKQYPL